MQNLITVTGHGEVRLKPDIVTLSLGIEERGANVAIPRQAAAQKAQDALKALRAAGVKPEEIQTSRYIIRREWEQETPPQPVPADYRPRGKYVFVVRNTVTVRTPMVDKVGDLIDAVVNAGFNDINGPDFSLKDDDQARRDALEAAVRDARAKADTVASASGVKVQRVESVTEAGSVVPPPRPYEAGVMFAKAADRVSTPVESGEIVITEDVTAAFRF